MVERPYHVIEICQVRLLFDGIAENEFKGYLLIPRRLGFLLQVFEQNDYLVWVFDQEILEHQAIPNNI